MLQKKRRESLDPQGSKLKGISGLIESSLRRFKQLAHAFILFPLYGFGSIAIGIALAPSIIFFQTLSAFAVNTPFPIRAAILGVGIAGGYFIFGFSLLFILPAVNFITRSSLKPWRGTYYSFDTVKWYIHNALTYLMRYMFLEFFTPTPFGTLFYQWMGMKIGRGSQINTTHISDPSLIEIGKGVTIGGSATICGHYGMAGYLILAPVKIGDGAIIGLRAVVMGGVEIGAHAKLLPNSVALPKTIIPPGETWGGVPAAPIQLNKKLD